MCKEKDIDFFCLKLLTKFKISGNISKLSRGSREDAEGLEKLLKKHLTSSKQHDIIDRLSRTAASESEPNSSLKIKQY